MIMCFSTEHYRNNLPRQTSDRADITVLSHGCNAEMVIEKQKREKRILWRGCKEIVMMEQQEGGDGLQG